MKVSSNQTSWPYNGMPRKIPFKDFEQVAILHLERFESAHREVAGTYHVLSSAPTILPSQCDQALDSVENLQQSIQIFNHFLDSSERLPSEVVPKRYSVLFSLHYIDELSTQLLPLIRYFRRICLDATGDADRTQRQIVRKLEILLETSEKVEPASQSLLE